MLDERLTYQELNEGRQSMKTILKPVLPHLASLLLMASMLALSVGSARASFATPTTSGALPGVVNGLAFAGNLQVPAGSGIASGGPLFPVSLGCNISNNTVSVNAASMQLGSFASSGSLTDTVISNHTATTASANASSTVQSVNILSSLITADTVTAAATSSANATSASSIAGATFVNLVVAGTSTSANPAPNTTIALSGLGSIVLNERPRPVGGVNHTNIFVNAIDVHVTQTNSYGLPIGTHIVIAHAESSFDRTTVLAFVTATAYGVQGVAKSGSSFVNSGPWAFATIGCAGGSSKVSKVGVTLAGVGSTGTVTDMASGKITSSGLSANSSSNVQTVNLLNAMITTDVVATAAQAAFSNGSGSASATTTLTNTKVSGVSLSANPAPNTQIAIAGLGSLVVNEQKITITATGASVSVNGFDLVVTMTNSYGLPVGTHIVIAHSDAQVVTA